MPAVLRILVVVLCAWACAVSIGKAESADALFDLAATQYRAGQWKESCATFKQLVTNYPEHQRAVSAHFYWAEALMQLNELTSAREHYQSLLEKSPSHKLARHALFRSGEAAWLASDDEAARADLEKFHKLYSVDELNEFVLPYLGVLDFESSNYETAVARYQASIESFPKGQLVAHSRLAFGRSLEKLGDSASAEKAYQELALGGDEQYAPHALYRLGMLASRDNQYDLAAAHFQQLATGYAKHVLAAKARLRLAHAQIQLGKLDDAIAQLGSLLDNEELAVEALYWRAIAQKENRDWANAVASLTKAIERAGQHTLQPALHYELLDCYATMGELEKSQAIAEALIRRWPDSPYAADAKQSVADRAARQAKSHFNAAVEHARTGTLEQALADLDLVVTNDKALDVDTTYLRAQVLEKLGRYDAALSAYYKLFDGADANPRSDTAQYRAGRLHEELRQSAEAKKLYSALAGSNGQFADDALYRWGVVAEAGGEDAEAKNAWQQLCKSHPQSNLLADALIALAKLAMSSDSLPEAQKLLSEAAQHETSAATRQRLLFQQGKLVFLQQRWTEVARPLEQLCQDYPDSRLVVMAKYWIAEATYQQHEYAAAAQQFADLADVTVDRSDSWLPAIPLRRAQALAQQRQWGEALDVAEQLQRDYPNFDEMYEVDYLIGRCHAAKADFLQAREAYDRVLSSKSSAGSETAAMAQFMTGETYFHQDDFASALRAYRKVDAYPFDQWQAAALLQAGKCAEQLGRPVDATQNYSSLLKRFPTSAVAEEARRLLDTAQQKPRGQTRK